MFWKLSKLKVKSIYCLENFKKIKTKKFKSGKFVKIKRFFSKLSINEMIKIWKGVDK